MITSYFAVYDKQSMSYGQLFPSQTVGTAERSFRDSVNNPESLHSKYPDDYELYLVLDIDDELGTVVKNYEPPQLVVKGLQLVK